MDPGSLPPPDSEGKEPGRQTATLPTTDAQRTGLGAPALLTKRLTLRGTLIILGPCYPKGAQGAHWGSLSRHHLHLTSNSIIHPSDLFQDLSHFQETWLAEGE